MGKPKFAAGYKAALVLVESLLEYMKQKRLKRSDLAHVMDVERSTVTKWLTPGRNLTIFTAASIADAIGATIEVRVKARDEQRSAESSQTT